MRVQEIYNKNNFKRHILVNDSGLPELTACKYLKSLDDRNLSPNTQKTYAYCLRNYFEFLGEKKIKYSDVTVLLLGEFINWLKNPYSTGLVIDIKPQVQQRSIKTINLNITVVIEYYDFLDRSNLLVGIDIKAKVIKEIYSGNRKRYKSFLHHVSKSHHSSKNILKLKEPKSEVVILSKEEITTVYNACNNSRDKFLIKLLYQTGLRIGEALSLHIEDFIYDYENGHRLKLVNRGELENNVFLKSGEREIFISQEIMDMFDEYAFQILDNLDSDSNFVFVNLLGKNKGRALSYDAVRQSFKRISLKTNINLYAHLIRHTHATIFYHATKDLKQIQERLGHRQLQTTANLYLHPSKEEIRKEWEKAQDAFKF